MNGYDGPDLLELLVLPVIMIIAIVFHEVAHGWTARLFGDQTAASMGRLTLNPIKHIDPFGTILLPLMLTLSGGPAFGWAKPVPVVPSRLRNPRWHMVLVAAAGPASNLAMAALAIWLAKWLLPIFGASLTPDAFIVNALGTFIMLNLFLAVFNMLPIPPFDGSKVLAGFLPDGARQRFQALDRYGMLIMLGVIVVIPWLAPQLNPMRWLVTPIVGWLAQFLIGG